MADHYILESDGSYYVHAQIPYGSTGEAFAVRGDNRNLRPIVETLRKNWWEVGGVIPAELVVPMKPTTKVTGYRLPEGIHLDDFPDYMTADEMQARRTGLDEDDEVACGPLQMFVVEREEVPVDDVVIDLTAHVLLTEDKPSAMAEMPAGSTWHGSLPNEIRNAHEYSHLFPGYLDGFAKWFAGEAEKFPTVARAYGFRGSEVSVFPKSGFGKHWEKKGQVDRVQGANLVDAIARWYERALAYAIASGMLREQCPTCSGKGYVE